MKKMQPRLKTLEKERSEPIAVVGMSCRFPGAPNADAFWRLLEQGEDAIREIPAERWDIEAYYDPNPDAPGKMYARYGGFVDAIDTADLDFFGIPPREAASMDPQQRWLLEQIWEAFEHAAIAPASLSSTRTGVFIGQMNDDYRKLIYCRQEESIDAYFSSGTIPDAVAGRLSVLLGLQGPNALLNTACSSALVAVHLACNSLRNRESDVTVAAGVNAIITPDVTVHACRGKKLSPDGRCKAFDARANGYVRGEGCGVIILKRLSDAECDNDAIWGLLVESTVSHDDQGNEPTKPNGSAQEQVTRDTLKSAGLEAKDIQYLEAYGIGTKQHDPIEIQAAAAVLAQNRSASNPLLIGSVKTNIGHLESASGMASIIKVLLALQHETIPKHLHFETPNPHIPWNELNLQVTSEAAPWPQNDTPRIAAVNSFGLSGTYAQILIQEPAPNLATDEEDERCKDREHHILTISARSASGLTELVNRYRQWTHDHPNASPGDLSYTANCGRNHFKYRTAFVFGTITELSERLDELAQRNPMKDPSGVVLDENSLQTAFLFTGQGSQYTRMGMGLYETEPVFKAELDDCAAVFDECRGTERPIGLLDVMFEDAHEELLNQTGYTQPALYALEVSLAALWKSWGVVPDVVLGHSVGEYAAACLAGVFSVEDGMTVIAERARLMQSLPAGGAMAALVGCEDEIACMLETVHDLSIAAYNGCNTVISGPVEQVKMVMNNGVKKGMRATRLNTSHAFHSGLMDPILETFRTYAEKIGYQKTTCTLISNSTGTDVESGKSLDASYWTEHLRNPVRFSESVARMRSLGCTVMLEIGPEPVLIKMGQRTDRGSKDPTVWTGSLRHGSGNHKQLLTALGKLYVHGLPIDFQRMDEPLLGKRWKIQLPTYPFDRKRHWIEDAQRSRVLPFD